MAIVQYSSVHLQIRNFTVYWEQTSFRMQISSNSVSLDAGQAVAIVRLKRMNQ